MKKRWKVIGVAVLVIVAVAWVSNYHATHSGPFVHFRLKYPALSTTELATQGSADVNAFFKGEPTKQAAVSMMQELRMQCTAMTPNDLRFETGSMIGKDIAEGFRCHHEYGFMPGIRVWSIVYLVGTDGKTMQGRSLLLCPVCQGA